jgi:hypothetical protein
MELHLMKGESPWPEAEAGQHESFTQNGVQSQFRNAEELMNSSQRSVASGQLFAANKYNELTACLVLHTARS